MHIGVIGPIIETKNATIKIDIVKDNNGKLSLCELELIEPELWFRNNPESATLLAKAVKRKLT